MPEPDQNDATANLVLIGQSVMSELLGRLDDNPSDRDNVAIATAITKATTRGFALGAEVAAAEIRGRLEANGLPVSFTVQVIDPNEPGEVDLWAEQYGREE